MSIQLSDTVRNARVNIIEATIGLSAVLKVRTGAPPANCAAADTGTVLATLSLPSDWLAAAAAGVKALSGIWQDLTADAGGTPGHFRIYDSTGVTCGMQGTVTATGGGGDMTIDNTTVAAGQQIVVSTFTLTEANA